MNPRMLCGLIAAVAAMAAAGSSFSGEPADLERLRQKSADIKTVRADFVQKKVMKILSRPLVSAGRFYFAAPDSLRWEYTKPLRSVVLSYRGNTRRFIFSGGTMIEDKTPGVQAMNIVLGEIAGWMSGRFEDPTFKAAVREAGDADLITLTPAKKDMSGMIEKIEIFVSSATAAVKKVKIIESADSSTVIDFKNVEINKGIKKSVFLEVE